MFCLISIILFFISGLIIDKASRLSPYQKIKLFSKLNGWFYEYVMGVDIKIHYDSIVSKHSDRMMIISNHPGCSDFLTIFSFHSREFPDHVPIFVLDKKFVRVPVMGKYYVSYHIAIAKKITDEELTAFQQFLTDFPQPFVLYIFPEGTTFCKEMFERSRKTPDGKLLDHVLIPKTKALAWFLPCVDSVSSMTILNHGEHPEYWSSLILDKYPHTIDLFLSDISGYFPKEENIYPKLLDLWKQKDVFLGIHQPEKEIHSVLKKMGALGIWIHFWCFLLFSSPSFFCGLLFLFSCIENYMFRRHFWFNKACLFGLIFLGQMNIWSWMLHLFLNLGFSNDRYGFKNK